MQIFYIAALEAGSPDAANRHVLEVCRRLSRRGHAVHLFIPKQKGIAAVGLGGVSVVPIPVPGHLPAPVKTLWFYGRLPFSACRYFKELHPEVVYTRASFLEWIAMAPLRKLFTFRYVAELNGLRSLETRPGRLRRSLISWMELRSRRMWDRGVAVTPELAGWACARGGLAPGKVAVIGNGVSTRRHVPLAVQKARRALHLAPDGCWLNFTGSLKPWHDLEAVIRALPAVIRGSERRVTLMVVGDGPERSRLSRLAQETGVGGHIAWVGRVPARSVPLYIGAADICLAPMGPGRNRVTGACPLKVLEYMSCGRPFVMSRLGLAFETMVLEQQCGVLVPPGDPGPLSQAVLRLMGDADMRARLGENGRRAARRFFDWDVVVERIEGFIR